MRRQTHIFATCSDLIDGLRRVEESVEIKYIRCDELRYDSNFEEFASLTEWNGLGTNATGNHISGYRFLIVPKKSKVKIERVRQKDGGVRYDLSQGSNPDSVSFLPGGIYDAQKVLVCGHIGTIWNSPTSIALYKAFVRSVTKGFEKVGAYRVGPEAARLMDAGYRMITISLGSPAEYDLQRPT